MELVQYIAIVRRWLWFILLSAFIAGSVAFIVRSNQPRVYQATTRLVIGSYTTSPNPDAGEIRVAFDLTRTYAELVRTFNILNATVQALNLPISPNALASSVSTNTITNTSLINITVQYGDPVLAADIANELANQLIRQSPTNLTQQQLTQLEIANEQIAALTRELDTLRSRLTSVDAQLAAASSQSQIEQLNEQRNTLVNQINQSTSNIATFSNTIASIQQRTNSLDIVEPAQIPTNPIGNSPATVTLLGVMVGAALAFGLALMIEYLNDTFRNADEVIQGMNLPVLGVISSFGKGGDGYREKLLSNHLFSQTLEEYRGLRINLLFEQDGAEEHVMKVLSVTSPVPADGKTLTAANLAVSMALAEKRVLLVDADLRRPKVADTFSLPNRVGLTSFLSGPAREPASGSNGSAEHGVLNWRETVQDPGISHLKVITSGFTPNNPTELLGSAMMRRWVDLLKASGEFDVVIFDTPPALAVSDTVVLATTIQSDVLLVLRANRTKRAAALKARERFASVGVKIAGVVLNGTRQRDENYYGYYKYYYAQEAPTKSQAKVK
ncbi:MAG TPA: polysaccharide biosynthesis tyrosine autokinase [Aggregatilineales bacterium]|nr:polysaccharide biosynthesis tyrosine autokinase [Aggregatilineales bacterium]